MKGNKEEQIRKDSKSIINRFKSIQHDANFVKYCAQKFQQLPIIPNERAGTWYVDPKLVQTHGQYAYFKSTDGHFGKWDFNMRRMNLHLIELINQSNGLVIVDTTRKGKRFPDSLSKTIPIWIATVNQAANTISAFPSNTDLSFSSVPIAVSKSEHLQIQNMIPKFVEKLLNCNAIDKKRLILKKPLKPIWIHPSTAMFSMSGDGKFWSDQELDELPFYPIILLSASISLSQGEFSSPPLFPPASSFDYIQGAADDSELWMPGLQPANFWELEVLLEDIGLQDLISKAQDLLALPLKSCIKSSFNWIGDTGIAVGNRRSAEPPACWESFDFIINCGAPEYKYESSNYLYLDIPEGKKGQMQFYNHLPIVMNRFKSGLPNRILVHCMQGKDRSVGIAMAMLIKFKIKPNILNKAAIIDSLLMIQSFRPIASPSRATLKKLDLFFIEVDQDKFGER